MENYFWPFFLILGVLALNQLTSIARSLQSLRRIEAMTERLLAHHGIEWEAEFEPSAKVRQLALNPKTYVEAIRAYRQQSGLGLKDAKAVIDALRVPPPQAAVQQTASQPLN